MVHNFETKFTSMQSKKKKQNRLPRLLRHYQEAAIGWGD